MNVRADELADDIETPEGEAPEPTLREQIESARDEYLEAHPAEAEQPKSQEGRVRDEHGRFVPRAEGAQSASAEASQNQPATATKQPGNTQAPAQGQTPNVDPGLANGALVAPNSWSAQAKAEWSKLPPTIRAEIQRREMEVHRTLTRQDEERQLGNSINEVVRANQEFFQRAGITPQRLFADYLSISKVLGGNDINAKANLIRQAALQNGIDLRALAAMGQPRTTGANPQPGAQPQPLNSSSPIPFHLLPPELQQVVRDNEERKQREQREAQERNQREEQQTYEQIVQFRSQPKARFFDAVRDQMVALLNGGAAPTLEEAYEQACWMRPDIRDILLKEQADAKSAEEARRTAALNARKKGISVRGGAGTRVETPPPDRSLREELQANFAEAQRQRV